MSPRNEAESSRLRAAWSALPETKTTGPGGRAAPFCRSCLRLCSAFKHPAQLVWAPSLFSLPRNASLVGRALPRFFFSVQTVGALTLFRRGFVWTKMKLPA